MLTDVRKIERLNVYQYTFLDDLSFVLSPYEYFTDQPRETIDEFVEAVKNLFLSQGWEGDGNVGIIWLPPFVDVGFENTWGTYIWHVKQNNNGISFLASEYPLTFARLAEQNTEHHFKDGKLRIPVNIIHHCVESFVKKTKRLKSELQAMMDMLRSKAGDVVSDNIIDCVTVHSQGMLVRSLHEFFDECYLQFLIEAIDSGNPSKIKIRRSKVNLSPSRYIPDDSGTEEYDAEAGTWFTLKGIVSDMWQAYKFESFPNKVEMLFKSIDFNWDQKKLAELTKHVILRNCIHHHEGVIDKDSLKQLGTDRIKLHSKVGPYEVLPWKRIWFSEIELLRLSDLLIEIADTFNSFVDARISTRQYLVIKKENKEGRASA